MKKSLLALALFFSGMAPAFADKVIGITDGDTLTVLHDGQPLKLRLANIDAPEKKQPFGERSKLSLSEMCFGKEARVKARSIDQYGRTVALVNCAGIEANRVQVERGMAWVYAQYNQDTSLLMLQADAQRGRRGLWADENPVPPWEFRHPEKQAASTVAANDAQCHTGPRGGRYRIVNGKKHYGC